MSVVCAMGWPSALALCGPCWHRDRCWWWVLVWAFRGWKRWGWLGHVLCPRIGSGGCHGLLSMVCRGLWCRSWVSLPLGCGLGWPSLLWVEPHWVTQHVCGGWGGWAVCCVLGQAAAAVVDVWWVVWGWLWCHRHWGVFWGGRRCCGLGICEFFTFHPMVYCSQKGKNRGCVCQRLWRAESAQPSSLVSHSYCIFVPPPSAPCSTSHMLQSRLRPHIAQTQSRPLSHPADEYRINTSGALRLFGSLIYTIPAGSDQSQQHITSTSSGRH
jgi:hypothetical protein